MIVCAQCGHRNPGEARFCENPECGAFLEFHGSAVEEHETAQWVDVDSEPIPPEEPGDYVDSVGDNTIVAICRAPRARERLRELGAKHGFLDRDTWRLSYRSDRDFVYLFSVLRELGFSFAAGRGWVPSAIFEHLRSRGELTGAYWEIRWADDGSWKKVER